MQSFYVLTKLVNVNINTRHVCIAWQRDNCYCLALKLVPCEKDVDCRPRDIACGILVKFAVFSHSKFVT